jgi:hypothetical protein
MEFLYTQFSPVTCYFLSQGHTYIFPPTYPQTLSNYIFALRERPNFEPIHNSMQNGIAVYLNVHIRRQKTDN